MGSGRRSLSDPQEQDLTSAGVGFSLAGSPFLL